MPQFIERPARSAQLLSRFHDVRSFTERICEPLETEDYVVQSMPDVSPTRWHLAHTTWFFETFVLQPFDPEYRPLQEDFAYLFNSYYNSVGQPYPRSRRGLLSRPTVQEIWDYRRAVEDRMTVLLSDEQLSEGLQRTVELGLHHEQQHQELILTDIKHVLSCNPLFPCYQEFSVAASGPVGVPGWLPCTGGIKSLGFCGEGFCFDNELPAHDVLLQDYQLQDRLVTNQEYLEFVADAGYRRPELWLSLGWSIVEDGKWQSPLYWHRRDGDWFEFTLSGLRPLQASAPVTHVSFFEADAFARWAGKRLPLESEWECAVRELDPPLEGNFGDSQRFHPQPAPAGSGLRQCFGDVWEWTASPYVAYPGYTPPTGALGEYNGKFMCNQFVLRGGSCASPRSHLRSTYRNFFPPDARWQFCGIRLAE